MATTVYVGHICNKIADESVRDILDLCGEVVKWNRQSDPISGKPLHFGFCEFKRLEGAWRASELLDGRQLGSKTLVIKADAKIQDRIQNYPVTQRINSSNEDMIKATVDALITTVNSKWRETAMATDAEVFDVPPAAVDPEFERALRKFEDYFQRELDRDDEEDEKERVRDAERKPKLIEQDGVDGFKVRSNFTSSDRRREIDFDQRDKAAEMSESGGLREEGVVEFKISNPDSNILPKIMHTPTVSNETDLGLEGVDSKVVSCVRQLPMSVVEIEKFDLHWPIRAATMKRVEQWLPNKILAIGLCTDSRASQQLTDEITQLVSGPDKLTVSELVFKLVMGAPDQPEAAVEQLSVRLFQLLIFDQLVLARG